MPVSLFNLYIKKLSRNKLDIKNVKCDKLIPNLFNKKNYVLHYKNAKLITQLGYKINN